MNKIRKIKKRYWVLTVIALVIIAFLLFKNNKKDSYTEYTVAEQDVSDSLLLAGTIDATERVDLGFASSGRVKKVNYSIGDTVKKGAIIAEIEQNRLSADLSQAQASYTLAKVDTQSDVSSANDSLENQLAEQNAIVGGLYREYLSGDLQAYNVNNNRRDIQKPIVSGTYFGANEGNYNLDMYSSNANSGYSFRLSGIESGTFTAETVQPGKMGENGLFVQFTSGNSYNNTEWVIPVPNTRSSSYTTRERAYESAVATRDRIIGEATNNVKRVSGSESTGQISRDAAIRAQARAQVDAVAAQLGDGKIRAPFSGIIAKHELEIGEIVNAFTTQVIMFGDSTKELNLKTPEIYINKIKVGDKVSVTLDAYDDINFDGEVSFIDFIDTEVDGVPVYETDIAITNDDPRIRVGMNAKASIVSKQVNNVVAIPAHYISEENGIKTVLLKTNDVPFEYITKEILTGLEGNEGLVEVISGLNAGDVIVLSGEK